MADNVSITPGSGATIRAKSIGGVETQIMQIDVGGESAESLVSPTNGLPTAPLNPPVGAGGFATSQASVGTTAALIVAARTGVAGTGRICAVLYNGGAATVYVGGSGVTTSTGQILLAGASMTISTTAAIYGITASGTNVVGVTETF